MHFRHACGAILGLTSLVASAPTVERDVSQPSERGLKWTSKAQKRSPLQIIQEVQETNVIVVEENLGAIQQLEQIAEQQFAELLQQQILLITEVENIKNNIRINHFKAKFSQVNTVIITVATIVDARGNNQGTQGNQNRYLVNQLLADNGKPESQIVVMVSDQATRTVGLSQTVAVGGASALSSPTNVPSFANFDSNAPFGAVNQSQILPVGSQAPKVKNVFEDPALIILPNQNNLFVEDANNFLSDCGFYQGNSNSFFSSQITQVFNSFGELSAAQAGSVTIIDVNSGGNTNTNNNGNGVAIAPAPPAAAAPPAPPAAAAPPAPPAAAASPSTPAPAGFFTITAAATGATPQATV